MELRAPHMLSALDPSDPSTVRVWCTEQALYKHFLTKILRCRQPNPVCACVFYLPPGPFCQIMAGAARAPSNGPCQISVGPWAPSKWRPRWGPNASARRAGGTAVLIHVPLNVGSCLTGEPTTNLSLR